MLYVKVHYKNRGSAQLVHYQRMHVVSKVSKRFPRYTWDISWTPWKPRAFSGRVQVAHSLYSCSGITTYFKLFFILFHLLYVYLYWCFAFQLRVYLYCGLGLRPPTICNIMRTVKELSGSSQPYHGFTVCADLYS